jgi:hypothetical protein
VKRRRFLQGSAATLLVAPRVVGAQPTREKRVGILGMTPMTPVNHDMFKQGIERRLTPAASAAR